MDLNIFILKVGEPLQLKFFELGNENLNLCVMEILYLNSCIIVQWSMQQLHSVFAIHDVCQCESSEL